jgi:hypothetical protein
VQEGLSVPVSGPSTIFPRGYLWLAPFWYAVVIAALGMSSWPPLWFRLTAAGGLLIALVTFVTVLSSISVRAFHADEAGIRLGLPTFTRRRGRMRRRPRELSWRQIERVRIAPRRNGAIVELILSSHAGWPVRAEPLSPGRRVGRALLLLIPFWYLKRPTGVATPLDGPPRYRVLLRNTTVDDLRQTLRTLAPAEVGIAVLVRRS